MVEYVISTGKADLSARNRVGNTALHLAALQGRDDVVDLLLQQPDIDDSVVNHEGKQVPSPESVNHTNSHSQAFEIAKTPDLSLNMQGSPAT
jgi:ankyrin repeat protein